MSLVLRHEEWLVGDVPLLPEILGQTYPPLQKWRFQIYACWFRSRYSDHAMYDILADLEWMIYSGGPSGGPIYGGKSRVADQGADQGTN